MKKNEKFEETMKRLDEHNDKTRMKIIAKAVALNVVLPIAAATAVILISEKLGSRTEITN